MHSGTDWPFLRALALALLFLVVGVVVGYRLGQSYNWDAAHALYDRRYRRTS